MPPAVTPLEATDRLVGAKATPFSAALERWMLRYARVQARQVLPLFGVVPVAKEDPEPAMRRELAELIRRFGLRQASDAATRVAGSLAQDAIAGKDVRIRVFQELAGWSERVAASVARETQVAVREAVRGIVADGRASGASAGEIARRIRSQLHGPDPNGRIHAFSPERAALIARTELAQAENAGIIAGYQATGVTHIEWLAYRDGRSGKRHHERMHGQRVAIGELFVLPSGARLRYPGDPDGPISETANCRCTTRPVRGPQVARAKPAAIPAPQQSPIAAKAEQHAAIDVGRPRTIAIDDEARALAERILARPVDPAELADLGGFPGGSSVSIGTLGEHGIYMNSRDTPPDRELQAPGGAIKVRFGSASETKQPMIIERGSSRYTLFVDASGTVSGDAPGDVLAAAQAEVDRLPYTSLKLQRIVFRDGGKTQLKNEFFAAFPPGRGLGATIFAQQVETARRLGVAGVKTYAAKGGGLVGYNVWARLGYDGSCPEPLASEFKVRTIQELMTTPEGRAAWRERGQPFAGTFDLADGSTSMRALERYLREKAQKAQKRGVSEPRGHEEIHLDAEDDAILDGVWDGIGRELGIRPPPSVASVERVRALWREILDDISTGFALTHAQRAPRWWIEQAYAKLRDAAKPDDRRVLEAERELILARAVRKGDA